MEDCVLIDLHNHTNKYSPCSVISPEDLIDIYVKNGIDGVCITEHNIVWSVEEQLLIKKRYEGKIKIFFGYEIDTDFGHVLVFSAKAPDIKSKIPIPLNKLNTFFPVKTSAFIWAHPYRCSSYHESHLTKLSDFDAIELYNGNLGLERIKYTYDNLRKNYVRFTGGSDTHAVSMACKYGTKFDDEISTNDELIKAIKFGNFKPVEY